jgi:hypothetical protein
MFMKVTDCPGAAPNGQAQEKKGDYLMPEGMDGLPYGRKQVFHQ